MVDDLHVNDDGCIFFRWHLRHQCHNSTLITTISYRLPTQSAWPPARQRLTFLSPPSKQNSHDTLLFLLFTSLFSCLSGLETNLPYPLPLEHILRVLRILSQKIFFSLTRQAANAPPTISLDIDHPAILFRFYQLVPQCCGLKPIIDVITTRSFTKSSSVFPGLTWQDFPYETI